MNTSRTPGGARLLWVLSVITLFLGTLSSSSRANHVHMQGGPFAGVVLSILVDTKDPKVLYCAAYGSGVFRSLDGGDSWTAMNQGLPNSEVFTLVAHPQNPGRLYLGTDQGIFHSGDNGLSWLPLSPTLKKRNIRALVFEPNEGRVLYAATDKGVFRGREGKWERFSRGLESKDVRALAASPDGRIYAATFGGIFNLENGGSSWGAINNGLGDKKVRTLIVDPAASNTLYAGTASGGVFKSADGGKTWRPANRGLLNTTVLSLAMSPTGPPVLYAATVGGVFKSANGGTRWAPTGPELPFTVSTLSLDPVRENLLYAGSGGRIFKSTDAGKRWEPIAHQVDHLSSSQRSARGQSKIIDSK